MAIALGTALWATGAPPPQTPSASHVNTNAIPLKLESLQPPAKRKVEYHRVGNMSSRPWTDIVGWQPGVSQFHDAENPGPGLTLLSVSFGPTDRQRKSISTQSPPR